jgi:acetylornithine/succinyldiaminopimelate/putrescine aminotransferase
MIFFRIAESLDVSENQLEKALQQQGILVHATGPRHFRLVTHYWIDDAAIETTISALRGALHKA